MDAREIAQQLRHRGEMFTDSAFSVPRDSRLSARRLKDHTKGHTVQTLGAGKWDIVQGGFATAPFVNALAIVLGSSREAAERLVVWKDEAVGMYQVQFWSDAGEWTLVTVDDVLPFLGSAFFCSRTTDPGEAWVSIVEKAYAKLHGGYKNIEGGSVQQALVDLTGGFPEDLNFAEEHVANSIRSGALWKRLRRYFSEGFVLGASYLLEDSGAEKDRGQGILADRSYAIIDMQELNGGQHCLVRMRNLWGRGGWRGRWSRDSKEWNAARAKQLNFSPNNDDGTFWIQWEDLVVQFNHIHVCRMYNAAATANAPGWPRASFMGEWRGLSAGGSMNNTTWLDNPQYGLHFGNAAPRRVRMFVCLAQPDIRRLGRQTYPNGIGFYVLRADSEKKKQRIFSEDEIVYHGHFAMDREVSAEISLQSGQAYIVVPATYDAFVEMPFRLSIFCEAAFDCVELNSGPTAIVDSQWKFETAGGPPNNPEWIKNPQWALLPLEDSEITISLIQPPVRQPKVHHAIGFHVLPSPSGHRIHTFSNPLAVGEYIQGPNTSTTFQLSGRTPVVIVPSTFLAMQTGNFKLKITSTCPFVLGKAPMGEQGPALSNSTRNAGRMNATLGNRTLNGPAAGRANNNNNNNNNSNSNFPPWIGISLVDRANTTGVMSDAVSEGVRWYTKSDISVEEQEDFPGATPTPGPGSAPQRHQDAAASRGGPPVSSRRSAAQAAASAQVAAAQAAAQAAAAQRRALEEQEESFEQPEQEVVPAEIRRLRDLGIDPDRPRKGKVELYGSLPDAKESLLVNSISHNLWSTVNAGYQLMTGDYRRSNYGENFAYDPEEARRVNLRRNNRVKNDYTEFVEYRARHNNLLKKTKSNTNN